MATHKPFTDDPGAARPGDAGDAGDAGHAGDPGKRALFISYRSVDGKKDAARLAKELRELFGAAQVFFDKHDLQGGGSWRQQIDQALHRRPIVLLVLSEQYFNARLSPQQRRIDQTDDPVRNEVLDALRVRAMLLPLLCEGVTMPDATTLPLELRAVPEAHALKLRTDDWDTDLLRLADRLVELGLAPLDDDWRDRYIVTPGAPRRWRLARPVVAGAVALAVAGGGGLWWQAEREAAQERDRVTQKEAAERMARDQAEREQRADEKRELARRHVQDGLALQIGQKNKLEQALFEYQGAVALLPDFGIAHYRMAECYAELGRAALAQRHFETALQHAESLDDFQRDRARVLLADLRRPEPTALAARGGGGGGGNNNGAPPPVGTGPGPSGTATGAATGAATGSATAQAPGSVSGSGSGGRAAAGAAAGPSATLPAPLPAAVAGAIQGPGQGAAQSAVQLVDRVPANASRQALVQTRAEGLFAAAADTRLAAAAQLGLEPGLLSDVLALALPRALAVLAHPPVNEADRAGVIATLRLVGSASALSLQAQREPIERLLSGAGSLDTLALIQGGAITATTRLAASAGRRPVVYLQLADPVQRPLAEALAARLRQGGYEVPAFEVVGARAPVRTELRAQGASHQGLARWLAQATAQTVGAPIEVEVLRRAQPAVDTYELWLGREVCLATGARPPACTGG